MIRTPSGKNLMNEQEAIQWLLDNNALPFQCTADYVGGAEIGLGTIVNPTPAKVRVGSLIFFADSKVSTVIAITSNSFICSDEYNDLVDDIVYVSNVQLNASGHLIVTLSNGTDIDAGLVKQISGFSINDSQHLIASFNDGTTSDLGAIFSGNVNIAGNLTADSIIENMSGYSFTPPAAATSHDLEFAFVGAVKNGNKITFAICADITRHDTIQYGQLTLGAINIPSAIGSKLYPVRGAWLTMQQIYFANDYNSGIVKPLVVHKDNNTTLRVVAYGANDLTAETKYSFRFEVTFLLSENLAA